MVIVPVRIRIYTYPFVPYHLAKIYALRLGRENKDNAIATSMPRWGIAIAWEG